MYTNRFETRYAGIALTVLLSTALSLSAHAAEIWKVNIAKSTFSSGSNTLVLERDSGKATTQGIDAKGDTPASTFLVISNGKIYLAEDGVGSSASHAFRSPRSHPWRKRAWARVSFFGVAIPCLCMMPTLKHPGA